MSEPVPEIKSIDGAIAECGRSISRHRCYSIVMVILLFAAAGAFYWGYHLLWEATDGIVHLSGGGPISADGVAILASHMSTYPYIFGALFTVVFGVLVAIYRFHLVEITRNEQMRLGFWRIRIAANNTEKGFQTEVRRALTTDAFSMDRREWRIGKTKDIESPVPGHPVSDLGTSILNKLLEKYDVNVTEKEKKD